MAHGDYSRRVRATSSDEVGQLADAFNSMAEDLASVDAMRREIVANVSHELRTPVTALRAQLENMVDGITATDPEHLRAALTQTERLGELVGYLLDLSRVEAGAVGLDLTDVGVRDLLDEVVAQVRGARSATGRAVGWAVEVVPADLHLRADRTRLAQVLANLLHNAARHTPPGTSVTVRARQSVLRQEVVIDVADQGEGIPQADRERIFERFQRGSAGVAGSGDGGGGTGLGLAIARWAVTLHGGTLTVVDPAGGQGATMRVRLPVRGPRRHG
jgi:signal transduction histidine kinase